MGRAAKAAGVKTGKVREGVGYMRAGYGGRCGAVTSGAWLAVSCAKNSDSSWLKANTGKWRITSGGISRNWAGSMAVACPFVMLAVFG